MFELNKGYTTKEVAKRLDISDKTFYNSRKNYEEHLAIFYDYKISKQGNAICYTFIKEKAEYIPYKEFKRNQKNKTITSHIHSAIHYDPRQTGSNIARVIIVDNEIQALNIKLSTLQVYVREDIKRLIAEGYYVKEDYQWCYLDKENNVYVEMSEEEVKKLRSYFHTKDSDEHEENLFAQLEEGDITVEEYNTAIGDLHKVNFLQGKQDYKAETGHWPMKVPVFVRNRFID